MAAKKKRPPKDDTIILQFADGVRVEVTETVAWLLCKHNKGARAYRYTLVGEAALQAPRAAESKGDE